MNYYGNINSELLALIPLGVGRVLEIGCGEAALAAAYKVRSPRSNYTAIELHGPAAIKAATIVDRLLIGDFGAMTDEEVTQGQPFDVIVLGDVLEHMPDTDAVLSRLHRLLADNGHLVLSVPNVAHWTAFVHLFNGQWPSNDDGLYDRTHLRFFTFTSLCQALARNGFRFGKGRPRKPGVDNPLAQSWLPKLAGFAQEMGIDRATFMERASTLQYVVIAEKDAGSPRLSLRVDVSAFAPALLEARTHLPATYLGSLPDLIVRYREREATLAPMPYDAPKLLILQRFAVTDARAWQAFLARAISAGWLVVMEYDDHPDLVARVHNRVDDPLRWAAMEQAHAVQTSTPTLAEAMRDHNPEVRAFANAAFTLPPFEPRADRPARVFFGALNREGFSGAVAASLAPVIAHHPDTVFEVVHDRAFFDGLPTANKRFRPAMRYAEFLDAMGECGIVLAPLEGAPAELFKSDIKYVEAASRGLAMIASPPVYAATIRDGETGLIAPEIVDWAPLLDRMLSDPAERDRIARTAWEDIRDHRMFADQAAARRDWYLDLWERRDALNASLLERVPGLREALA